MDSKAPAGAYQRIVEIFETGKRFTEELLRENERLRLAIERLRADVKSLQDGRSFDANQCAEREELLQRENAALREELRELRERYNVVEKENWDFAERYLDIERQNTGLLNLYVASYRLHSTLTLEGVVAILKEIIINLVGSECFEIVLFDPEAGLLHRVATEGLSLKTPPRAAEGQVARCLETGRPHVGSGTETPVACIPLNLLGKAIGAIVIEQLLPQKGELGALDQEMFELLGEYGAAVMCAAHCYSAEFACSDGVHLAKVIRSMVARIGAQ